MSDSLPKFIDPLSLADKNAHLAGTIPLNSLSRLHELLVNEAGKVSVSLFFSKEGKTAKIRGHISAILAVKCQRCLERIEWPIESEIKLGVVSSLDQVNKLPESLEPLLLPEENKILLTDIIEDEILILLPDIPKHSNNCAIIIPSKNGVLANENRQTAVKNPFSILAKLNKLETFNGSTKK